jgi:hypothetical protein
MRLLGKAWGTLDTKSTQPAVFCLLLCTSQHVSFASPAMPPATTLPSRRPPLAPPLTQPRPAHALLLRPCAPHALFPHSAVAAQVVACRPRRQLGIPRSLFSLGCLRRPCRRPEPPGRGHGPPLAPQPPWTSRLCSCRSANAPVRSGEVGNNLEGRASQSAWWDLHWHCHTASGKEQRHPCRAHCVRCVH